MKKERVKKQGIYSHSGKLFYNSLCALGDILKITQVSVGIDPGLSINDPQTFWSRDQNQYSASTTSKMYVHSSLVPRST